MSSAIALICMVALLFAAGGLLLWQRARNDEQHTLAEHFVERQMQPGGMAAHGSVGRRGDATPGVAPDVARSATEGIRGRLVHACAFASFVLGNATNRAGIVHGRVFLSTATSVCLLVALWAGLRAGLAIGVAALASATLCVCVLLSWLARKRHQRIVRQLPVFLDGIVRLITIGNSVPAAFQAALLNTEAPLRACLDRVSRMLRTGSEIDYALTRAAQIDGVRELELLGVVLRISVKYGGRSDVMLDRMSVLMRDIEHADRELAALSTETRMSAWVLSVLPLLIGGFVIVSNPRYFHAMWGDPFGQKLVYTAFGLQAFGAFLLYRLARLRS